MVERFATILGSLYEDFEIIHHAILSAEVGELQWAQCFLEFLFGVDINPNSCEITKLRLWIELLKYSYYKDIENKYLETLPNIDINIKCGNSIISRFDLRDSLKNIPKIDKLIKDYKCLVSKYKNADGENSKHSKREIEIKINEIKENLTLNLKDPKTINSLEKEIQAHIDKYGMYLIDDKNLLSGLTYTKNLLEI